MLIGYPCFRCRITGHYFALLTLALTEFVRLCIVGAARLHRRLARHPAGAAGNGMSLYALQFEPDSMLSYYICFALWLLGLYIWLRVDASMDRYALDAASQDEDAAAMRRHRRDAREARRSQRSSAGCARWAAPSSASTRCISVRTPSPASASRSTSYLPSSPAACGRALGPTVGAVFTQVLAEGLRVAIQGSAILRSRSVARRWRSTRWSTGCCSIMFIIYMPKGILGTGTDWWRRWRGRKA